mmetsp:Transcript_11493/g.24782  ORF Transcript_11493/g.24782 Transcript_11493/m.24782 type:complete len:86 (-) Transcript_11493:48-305(-)
MKSHHPKLPAHGDCDDLSTTTTTTKQRMTMTMMMMVMKSSQEEEEEEEALDPHDGLRQSLGMEQLRDLPAPKRASGRHDEGNPAP